MGRDFGDRRKSYDGRWTVLENPRKGCLVKEFQQRRARLRERGEQEAPKGRPVAFPVEATEGKCRIGGRKQKKGEKEDREKE